MLTLAAGVGNDKGPERPAVFLFLNADRSGRHELCSGASPRDPGSMCFGPCRDSQYSILDTHSSKITVFERCLLDLFGAARSAPLGYRWELPQRPPRDHPGGPAAGLDHAAHRAGLGGQPVPPPRGTGRNARSSWRQLHGDARIQ